MDNNNIFDLAMGLSMASMMSSAMGKVMESSMKQQIVGAVGEPNIFALVDGKKYGPYTAENISEFMESGRMDSETYIWKAGMSDWMKIKDVLAFKK